MTDRIKVGELMQRDGLRGDVVKLFPSWRAGIIHGDDGDDVTFSDDSLVVGFAYSELSLGLRVSYGVFFAAGAKVPTAINVKPVSADHADDFGQSAVTASARVGRSVPRS